MTISAVAVLPSHRRSGIGTALTAAVIALAPDKPATLSTSDSARACTSLWDSAQLASHSTGAEPYLRMVHVRFRTP